MLHVLRIACCMLHVDVACCMLMAMAMVMLMAMLMLHVDVDVDVDVCVVFVVYVCAGVCGMWRVACDMNVHVIAYVYILMHTSHMLFCQWSRRSHHMSRIRSTRRHTLCRGCTWRYICT